MACKKALNWRNNNINKEFSGEYIREGKVETSFYSQTCNCSKDELYKHSDNSRGRRIFHTNRKKLLTFFYGFTLLQLSDGGRRKEHEESQRIMTPPLNESYSQYVYKYKFVYAAKPHCCHAHSHDISNFHATLTYLKFP